MYDVNGHCKIVKIFLYYDPNAPRVRITKPSFFIALAHNKKMIEGVAESTNGIEKVELRIDYGEYGLANGTDNWQYLLDVTDVSAFPHYHFITAKATDTTGKVVRTYMHLIVLRLPGLAEKSFVYTANCFTPDEEGNMVPLSDVRIDLEQDGMDVDIYVNHERQDYLTSDENGAAEALVFVRKSASELIGTAAKDPLHPDPEDVVVDIGSIEDTVSMDFHLYYMIKISGYTLNTDESALGNSNVIVNDKYSNREIINITSNNSGYYEINYPLSVGTHGYFIHARNDDMVSGFKAFSTVENYNEEYNIYLTTDPYYENNVVPEYFIIKPTDIHLDEDLKFIDHLIIKFNEYSNIYYDQGEMCFKSSKANESVALFPDFESEINELNLLLEGSSINDIYNLFDKLDEYNANLPGADNLWTSVNEAQLLKQKYEAETGKELLSLSLFYHIILNEGVIKEDIENLINNINKFSIIQICYAKDKPIQHFAPKLSNITYPNINNVDDHQINFADNYLGHSNINIGNLNDEFVYPNEYDGSSLAGVDAMYAWQFEGGRGEARGQIEGCTPEYFNFECSDAIRVIQVDHDFSSHIDNQEYTSCPLGCNDLGITDSHGTLIAGIVGMDENDNLGIGVAHRAEQILIPTSVSKTHDVPFLYAAKAYARKGDIIQFSMYMIGLLEQIEFSYWTAEGIHVIQSAGNSGVDLDDPDSVLFWWKPNNDYDPAEHLAIKCPSCYGIDCIDKCKGMYLVAMALYILTGDESILDNFELTTTYNRIFDSGSYWVGGIDPNLGSVDFLRNVSNYGSRIDLQAWYYNVYTLSGDGVGYRYTGGTSSATPIVAGAVACFQGIYKAHNNGETMPPAQLRSLLYLTGSPVDSSSRCQAPIPDLRTAINFYFGIKKTTFDNITYTPTDNSSPVTFTFDLDKIGSYNYIFEINKEYGTTDFYSLGKTNPFTTILPLGNNRIYFRTRDEVGNLDLYDRIDITINSQSTFTIASAIYDSTTSPDEIYIEIDPIWKPAEIEINLVNLGKIITHDWVGNGDYLVDSYCSNGGVSDIEITAIDTLGERSETFVLNNINVESTKPSAMACIGSSTNINASTYDSIACGDFNNLLSNMGFGDLGNGIPNNLPIFLQVWFNSKASSDDVKFAFIDASVTTILGDPLLTKSFNYELNEPNTIVKLLDQPEFNQFSGLHKIKYGIIFTNEYLLPICSTPLVEKLVNFVHVELDIP